MRRPLVVDVSVLFSDKFLQSKELDLIVPQIQFILRVWDFAVVSQRRVRTVQTVQKTGDSPGAVLGRCRHARCYATTRLWFRQCRKLWRFRSCSSSTRGRAAVNMQPKFQQFSARRSEVQFFAPLSVHLDVESRLSTDFLGSPRWLRVLRRRGARGWRRRRESDSQVFCHM